MTYRDAIDYHEGYVFFQGIEHRRQSITPRVKIK